MPTVRLPRPACFVRLLAPCILAGPLAAQAPSNAAPELAASRARLAAETYVAPSSDIAKMVTAHRQMNALLSNESPDRRLYLRELTADMPTVKQFGKFHYYFAGLQVDPSANRARSLTTRGLTGLQIVNAATGGTVNVEIPAGATASAPVWSPDGKQLAFIANFENASQVYLADATTGKARLISPAKTPLLATLVTSVDWLGDGSGVVAVLVPDARGPMPSGPDIATGPKVRLWTDPQKSPQRNFASLLDTPYDMALMEYFVTGQLAVLDLNGKTVRKLGAPAMIESVEPSPDGKYFRVTTMRKPFSYMVQYGSFGDVEEIWDGTGKVLAEVVKRKLRETPDTSEGFGRREEGAKRMLAWMPAGGGLSYVEAIAQRGGDSTRNGQGQGGGGQGANTRPDRVMKWLPPFGAGDTAQVYRSDGPIATMVWSADAGTLFLGASRNGTGELFAVHPAQPDKKLSIARQRGYTPSIALRNTGGFGGGGGRGGPDSLAFYANPGTLMTTQAPNGVTVAMISSDSAVYLNGMRYNVSYLENIPRPFVDKVTINTGAKNRVYEGAADVSETLTSPMDPDFKSVVVVRETPTDVPNAFRKDLAAGTMAALTTNKDLTPEFTNLVRRRVTVTRADGIKFVVRLTLPSNYQSGTRLPGMFWFYPYEYTDQAGYDRTLRNENVKKFPASGPRTIEFLATEGYAVANFDPPIIGEAGRMNDNYVSDLRMNLYAVIDELDRQGYIDRTRLGIGGHSYGAFSTVNAMVNTPFFKAGIAGDGMYNRTLTPTGFQSERRDLWSGQKTYLDMSPMLNADKLQGALLMYHNLEDQNVGTDPISSIRMMQALRSEGKVASLYLYPYEDHGPATSETILDLWGRWTAWLDVYVKHAGQTGTKAVSATSGGLTPQN